LAFDLGDFLTSILGSAVAIVGSIAVAWIYVRNENRKSDKTRVYERIQETFFEKGLHPMESALSAYGFAATYAIMDARTSIARCLMMNEESKETMKEQLRKIAERPLVSDLVSRNFSLSMQTIPNTQRFGLQVHDALGRTFQFISAMVGEVLDLRVIEKNSRQQIGEFVRSLGALAMFANLLQTYVARRLINVRDYLWDKQFDSYEQFVQSFDNEKYKRFLASLTKYSDYLSKMDDALRSQDGKARATLSLEFSKWLNDNMDNNLLL
jgi:hypothetical protein